MIDLKICMVLPGYFPPDIRVEKEARTLIADGHEIHLVCMGADGQPQEGDFHGINIHRLQVFSKKYGKLSTLVYTPFFLNLFWRSHWINKIKEIIRKNNIEIIHVHDLPVVPIVISIAKKSNIPIIFDMHENWPEALRVWGKRCRLHVCLYNLIFNNVTLYKILEKYCVKNVDRLICSGG